MSRESMFLHMSCICKNMYAYVSMHWVRLDFVLLWSDMIYDALLKMCV